MRSLARMLFTLAALAASAVIVDWLYRRYLREWVLTWGATPEEATATLPGDELLDSADIVATRDQRIDPVDQPQPITMKGARGRDNDSGSW
jgi:hypothetical protein